MDKICLLKNVSLDVVGYLNNAIEIQPNTSRHFKHSLEQLVCKSNYFHLKVFYRIDSVLLHFLV